MTAQSNDCLMTSRLFVIQCHSVSARERMPFSVIQCHFLADSYPISIGIENDTQHREYREFNENRENSIAKLPSFSNLTKSQ